MNVITTNYGELSMYDHKRRLTTIGTEPLKSKLILNSAATEKILKFEYHFAISATALTEFCRNLFTWKSITREEQIKIAKRYRMCNLRVSTIK